MDDGKSYKRVILKLSGQALGEAGLDPDAIEYIADELVAAHRLCSQIGLVIGAGNLVRGAKLSKLGMDRVRCDQAGMIGTVLNCLLLQAALDKKGLKAESFCAFPVGDFIRTASVKDVKAALDCDRIVLMAGGTGNPFFTTDTAAALRAAETGAEILLKATKVDGVYSEDPVADPSAVRYESLTYMEILEKRLRVMDLTAISLCMDNQLPIRVFDFFRPGGLADILGGGSRGTIIC